MIQVSCAYLACKESFLVDPQKIGWPVECPRCKKQSKARPTKIWEILEKREAALKTKDEKNLFYMEEKLHKAFLREQQLKVQPTLHEPAYSPSYDKHEINTERADGLCAVLDDLRSQWNTGSIFRTADGTGIGELVLCGITPIPPAKGLIKTALGAQNYVPWIYKSHIEQAISELIAKGFVPVALEQTDDAIPIDDFECPSKVALIVGNEVTGISAEALMSCKNRIYLPMAGNKASFNVSVSFGIASYLLAKKWKQRFSSTK